MAKSSAAPATKFDPPIQSPAEILVDSIVSLTDNNGEIEPYQRTVAIQKVNEFVAERTKENAQALYEALSAAQLSLGSCEFAIRQMTATDSEESWALLQAAANRAESTVTKIVAALALADAAKGEK